MKKMSPLAMLQKNKMRKFSQGGSAGYIDPVVAEAMAQDLEDFGATNMDDIWGQGVNVGDVIDAEEFYAQNPDGAYFQGDGTPVATEGQMWAGPSVEDIQHLVQFGGQPSLDMNMLSGLTAIAGAQPHAPTQPSEAEEKPQEKGVMQWLTSMMGSNEQKPFNERAGIPQDTWDKMSPAQQAQLIAQYGGRYQEQSPFQKLLQLGMVGIGGLASFSDTKSKNKAMKDYYARLDQQRADQQAQYQADRAQAQRYYVPSSSFGQTSGTFRRPT